MSVQLLDKTRKINQLLHNNNTSKVVFNDICDVLTGILNSNILVISRKGKVLGVGLCDGVEEIRELIVDRVGGYIDPLLNERLRQRRTSIWRPLVLKETMYGSIRRSSIRSILQESGSALYLCTRAAASMRLMTLS